jgi:Holliday junction resolvase RusA-like endonuclease
VKPITFTVYGEPKTAGSKRAFNRPGAKYPTIVDDNPKSRDWKEHVSSAARQTYSGALLTCALCVSFAFYRIRPASHYNGKGELNKTGRESLAPATRPDVLKLARAVEDAMTGVVYRDDAQIVDERLTKLWGEPARVEISILPLEKNQ